MIGRDAERAGIVLGIVVVDAVDDEQRLRKEQESEQHEQRGPPAPHLERRGEHRRRVARGLSHRGLIEADSLGYQDGSTADTLAAFRLR